MMGRMPNMNQNMMMMMMMLNAMNMFMALQAMFNQHQNQNGGANSIGNGQNPNYSNPAGNGYDNGPRNYDYPQYRPYMQRDPYLGLPNVFNQLPHRHHHRHHPRQAELQPWTPQEARPYKPHHHRETQAPTGNTGYVPVLRPLQQDLRDGAHEIRERHAEINEERRDSRFDYARGEHGLGREIVNQAWSNAKENLGDAKTAVVTAGKVAYDVAVEVPARALYNVGKAAVDSVGEAVAPVVQDLRAGVHEIQERHERLNVERDESRAGYANGEHGLGREVVNQAWTDTKEVLGAAKTAVTTGVGVAVDASLIPLRTVGGLARRAWGGLRGMFN
jgi:hypothetical protein